MLKQLYLDHISLLLPMGVISINKIQISAFCFKKKTYFQFWALHMTEPVENDALEKGIQQPLLITSEEKPEDEDGDQECDGSEEAAEESHRPATSIRSAYRLLTASVKVIN